ncbi:hypothetical protein BDA99DRAFT_496165 [Phascolomyces articulosus]|uniref:Uncharacterized protein n=1 Tax=Phascolomyces articulosus TaxID=60185 RepID=A0AAD5KMS8_9FUNG|nr:hypothetical protein BDA99DRAFT_496165 [Phascolomyces articulosus]
MIFMLLRKIAGTCFIRCKKKTLKNTHITQTHNAHILFYTPTSIIIHHTSLSFFIHSTHLFFFLSYLAFIIFLFFCTYHTSCFSYILAFL